MSPKDTLAPKAARPLASADEFDELVERERSDIAVVGLRSGDARQAVGELDPSRRDGRVPPAADGAKRHPAAARVDDVEEALAGAQAGLRSPLAGFGRGQGRMIREKEERRLTL